MKPIELTKEQKNKLLEMCKKLFPEYWILELDVPNNLNNKHLFIIGFLEGNDYIPGCDLYMHWFEFCWNILNKILANKPPLYILEQIQLFGMTCFNKFPSVHPVDYLYEEFKKLKV